MLDRDVDLGIFLLHGGCHTVERVVPAAQVELVLERPKVDSSNSGGTQQDLISGRDAAGGRLPLGNDVLLPIGKDARQLGDGRARHRNQIGVRLPGGRRGTPRATGKSVEFVETGRNRLCCRIDNEDSDLSRLPKMGLDGLGRDPLLSVEADRETELPAPSLRADRLGGRATLRSASQPSRRLRTLPPQRKACRSRRWLRGPSGESSCRPSIPGALHRRSCISRLRTYWPSVARTPRL